MGQDRPINALLPGFAQVHVFNSTRIKPFIPVYMPITMYLGVFAQNTPRSRVSACFHLPSTALTALHVLSKCQTRVWLLGVWHRGRRAYWDLFWWTLLSRPRKFHAAMELSILGHHFRRIANAL